MIVLHKLLTRHFLLSTRLPERHCILWPISISGWMKGINSNSQPVRNKKIENTMTTLLLHDCMSPVSVGRTSIPLPPTFLVSVIPYIPVLVIASVRPFMCLLSD